MSIRTLIPAPIAILFTTMGCSQRIAGEVDSGRGAHMPRLTLAALLVVVGSVGVGCMGEPAPIYTAEEFCVRREVWLCERDQAAGRTTTAEEAACLRAAVERLCDDAQWAPGCAPTGEAMRDCINLLSRGEPSILALTNDEALMRPECDLCR